MRQRLIEIDMARRGADDVEDRLIADALLLQPLHHAVARARAPAGNNGPPPAPTEPDPTAVPDENDPYIGGFNRFAQNFRRREMEAQARAQAQAPTRSPLPDGQTLSRGFERHAEEQTPKTGWDHEFLPEPPGFEARQRARRSAVPEPSGLLVLGIPDEEGGDVPVRRVRPYSAGLGKRPAPDSGPSESFSAELAMLDEASELLPIAHAQPGPPDDALGHDPTPGPFDDDDAAPIARPASVPFDDDDAAPVARPTPAPFDDDDAAPFVAKPAPGPYDDDDDAAPFVAKPASGPYDDDDDAAPFVAGPETVAHAPSGPQPDAPQAATHALSGPYDDDDDAPPAAAHAHSGPHGSGPQAVAHATSGPQSGPQAAARPISGPQHSSGPHRGPPPPPPPRNGPAPGNSAKRTPPPPPPRDAVKVTRTKTASASPVPPADPKARRAKPVKKKVVELSQPVARPISAPVVMAPVRPSAAPSERSGHRPIPADDEVLHPQSVPDYLRDDDE